MAKNPVPIKPSSVITSQATKHRRARKGVASKLPRQETDVAGNSSKTDQVLTLLKRADGATRDDLMQATQWQSHSIRGFLSGTVRKRKGLTLVSEVSEQGFRRYRIAGEAGA
jgi:hypothetical protein